MVAFSPFEVNVPHLVYTILGAFVVIFGMFSLIIKEKLYIGEAPIALIVGIIMGPHVTGLFDPSKWGGPSEHVTDEITLEVTRIIIAVSVFAVGVELPKAYMWRHWRTLTFLLLPCMLWGWMVSALLMWGLIPHLTFLSALLIASAVTPTDPILAQAVIGGSFADKHVPAHVRHMLSAESGSNDGAAFPFLGIALYLTLDASPGHAVGHWVYYTLLYEIVLGVVLGALLGFAARKIMKLAERKRFIDRQSYVAQYISLAVLATGMTSLLGSDDLLSAFACGCAFAWDGFFNKATEDAVFSNVIDLLFNSAAFIYIGAIMPFDDFNSELISWWRLVVLAICVLLLRRLPVILALYKWIPDIKTFREAAFTGWFGPMGVGAIFIGTLAKTSLPEGASERNTEQVDLLRETIQPIVAFLVLSSIIAHGMSIPFFSLGRRVHSITYTWSRNPSMDTRRDNEPAWTTHARRIVPGQEIRVNRDDDAEEGDVGLQRQEKSGLEMTNEKTTMDDGSGGSGTAVNSDGIEMTDRHGSGGESSGHSEEAAAEEEDDGTRTPPLAEFREGNHLIRETKTGSGNEIKVEVIRNHFHDDKPTENKTFLHPHRLKHGEVDKLASAVPHSADHAVLEVEDGGRGAVDRLGLGLMKSRASDAGSETTSEGQGSPDREHSPERGHSAERIQQGGEGSGEHGGDDDWPDSDEEERGRKSKGKSGKKGKKIFGGLFRKKSSSPSPLPTHASPNNTNNPNLLSPPSPQAYRSRPIPITQTSNNSNLQLTRTISNSPNSTSIRFADGLAASSGRAPGPANYGANVPGFKRNPTLAMFRSSSIQDENEDEGGGDGAGGGGGGGGR